MGQAAEKEQRADHEPYLGALVGLAGSKKGGLIKKGIKFLIGGQEWGLTAYYTEAHAKSGNLLRPQAYFGSCLVSRGLNPEFFAQPRKTTRTVVMVDDGGEGPATEPSVWHKAKQVFAGAYPHAPLAAALVANSAPQPAALPAPALAAAPAPGPSVSRAALPTSGPPALPAALQPVQQPLPPAGAAAPHFEPEPEPELDYGEDFAAAEAQLRADILAGGGTISDSPPPVAPSLPSWDEPGVLFGSGK